MTQTKLEELLADKQNPNLEAALELAAADDSMLALLVAGLQAKNDAYRFNCFKTLSQLARTEPATLYPRWDSLVELLDSPNAFHRSSALRLLAQLTPADDGGRFEAIFERYFGLLDDPKVMVARYLAQSAQWIAAAKPHLREQLTGKLLSIDQTHHTSGRQALIKADAIETLASFFEDSSQQDPILSFVRGELDSESPTTRKAAKGFLDRFGRQA